MTIALEARYGGIFAPPHPVWNAFVNYPMFQIGFKNFKIVK